MVLVGGSAWAGDKTVVKYSFDDANSPSLTAGSRVSFDYDKTSVITSTKFLNAWNNANGDPGPTTVSLGSTDLSGETWTLSFEWAACGGCNSKPDHTTLKAGDTNLFDLTGNSNWNTTVTLTYSGSDGTQTLPVPGCNKSYRFTAGVGNQLNTTDYWHHIVVTGSAEGVKMTITNSSTGTAVVENIVLSETNVNPTSLILEPCCGGGIGIDELSLTYYVEGDVIQTPIAAYTAVNGNERTITATCDTEGATIQYSTDGTSWTDGASLTVSVSGNVYFKAVKGTSESDVLTFAAVAGEAITLNAPAIVRSDNTTVTITADQANLLLSPTATITYEYGNEKGSFTGSKTLTVAADATITAYAEATGYTTSATSELAVALFPTYVNKIENTAAATQGWSANAFSEETKTVSERTYAALMLDDAQWGTNVYFQTDGAWGFRASGNWYINSDTEESWILMPNMKKGDIIVVDASYPASSTVNATYSKYAYGTKFAYEVTEDGDVELAFKKIDANTMDYLYGVYAYTAMTEAEIALFDAKAAFQADITAAKAIETEGKEGVEALQTAIATAETALAAEDATTESLTNAKNALVEAVAAFVEANKPAFDPATAIVNAGFNPEADPLGWDKVTSAQYYDLGMGLIGTYQVRGEHPAATVDETHLATEFAAGLECRWQTSYAAFTQTTAELPAGAYKLTFDVENTNATTTKANYENRFNVTVGETTYADESTEWMDGKSAWTTHTIAFTLTEASPITISLGYGTGSNNFGVGNTPALFVSHLTLEAINSIEIALIDLQTVIEAAQAKAATYTVGTELFTYAESEIKPLNDAIATAQAAYTAAESAEAVKSATETLNAFVATFAPVMNKPAADKEYVITNKNAELALSIGNEAVKIETEGVVKFTEVEGGWVLSNNLETPEYVFKTTGNTWTLSTTANKDESYVVNFNLADGAYTIQGANGLFGTDNITEGSAVYANKAQSNNGLWTIAEYVAPVEPEDYTSYIVNADLTGEGGFDATETKGFDGSGIVKVSSGKVIDFKQTIANLPAGKYKVTAQAAYRYSDGEAREADSIAAGVNTKFAKLYATVGTTTVDTLVQNRYDGASETNLFNGEGGVSVVNEKYVPNSSDAVKAWFAAGKYVNEVVFNLPADGAVTIGIVKTQSPEESDYTVIGPWTLTRLGDAEVEPEPEPEPEPFFADGKYYIYNNGTKNYLAAGADWGTHAVVNATGLDYTLTQADGKYTIDSQVSNGGESHFLNGEWNDGAAMGWTFAAVEGKEGVYTISNGEKFLTAAENNLVTLADDATAEAAQWSLKTLEARIAELATATAEAPVNATFLIQDANFGRNDLRKSAWTIEAANKNLSGGNNTNNCAESFHSTFTLSQVLAGAPKGVYAMTAQGFYRQDGAVNDTVPYFFANDEKMTFPVKTGTENSMSDASASFSAGNYTIDPIFVEVTEAGQLTIGAKCDTTTVWAIWDNFVLSYYGAEATIDQAKNAAIIKELAELRAKATELKEQVEVAVVKTAVEDALTATANVEGAEAINAAIATMKEAVDKADASVSAKAKLANMKQLVDATNVYTAEALNEYYTQWEVKYQDGTITKAEAAALQDPFVVTGWHAALTCDNFLLSAWDTNPDFQNARYYINSWSTEGNNDGSEFKVPFFEYWTGDDNSLAKDTLTATMKNLKPGYYEVSAWVRVRAKNGYTAPAYGIALQANDGEAVNVADGAQIGESQFYLKEVTAAGFVAEDSVLKIKFNVAEDNNISWLSFKNVKFEKKPAPVVPIDGINYSWESPEGDPMQWGGTIAYVNGDGERLNYLNSGYYTICLNGKKANLPDTVASANAGKMVITLDKPLHAGDTIAYTAYLNKNTSKEASAYILFENGTAVEGEVFGDEANIDAAFNGVPTLKYTIVPAEAAGSKTITLTRSKTGTNLFITKLQVIATQLELTLDVERYPGMGYGAQEATVDFARAKAYLGVEEITTDMLRIVNPNDSLISDYAPFDGWFNGEGAAETWNSLNEPDPKKAGICVKFFEAIPEGKFSICDMNGADSIGAVYTTKWALVANEKQVTYTINVKFVEKPVIALTLADLNKVDEQTVALTSELGKCYEGLTADVDVAAILAKLEVASLNDVTIYAVQSDGSLDDNYKLSTTDGWRNAAGDWQTWGNDAYFFVKTDFALESGQIYAAGGMDGKNTTEDWENPATYTATYAFVKGNDTHDAVVLKVTLTYTVPTGINAIARDAQNADIYNINGQKVNKAQKGLYIINGKKTVVK